MKHTIILATLFSAAVCLLHAEIPIKSGDKVAFLGDSITQQGQNSPGGYVQLIGTGLAANSVKIEIIGAGISGHKSDQMLERLDRDVLSKKPQWMTLTCGVNDVWHGDKGVPLEDYKKNITSIVDQAQAAGIKVIILTSTMIREDQTNPENQKLVAYNEFLRALAKEKKCLLADLNADMQAAVTEAAKSPRPVKGNYLTVDGVHMAPAGNLMMTAGVLKGLGLNATELSKAWDACLDVPNASEVSPKIKLTLRQALQLDKLAAKRGTTVDALINESVTKLVTSMVKSDAR
ncbi:MAG: SGNH/GDSL hydrolase family protein [Luteolibacter sp.]